MEAMPSAVMNLKRRRPRALTLTLPDAKQPFLIWNDVRYTLRNFSQEGLGLWVPPPAPFGMNKGQHISGNIVIGKDIHAVKLEIVHTTARMVGLKILHKSPELTEIFRELLEPATHAAELTFHPRSQREDASTGHPRLWFVSGDATELLVWYGESTKMILGLQLCWSGKWVYRAQFRPVRTGHLRDSFRHETGAAVKLEELLEAHAEPDTELLQQAARFLTAIPLPLPGHLFWQFLETGEQVFLPPDLFPDRRVA
jgi:hypothetical protein